MENYTEPANELQGATRDVARALVSLKEEIDAVNMYQQRVDVSADQHLKKILAHNRDEEIEHVCMLLEWLRRNDEVWNRDLNKYLFSSRDIVKIEEE
ncbi:MAG: hypothetical protein LKI53_00920 [Bacteroidales bacterium]|jgi:ferritin-like protein|nr:hypothetical protein [Bacteroidales bacterium]